MACLWKAAGFIKKPKFVLKVRQCIYVQIFTNEGEFKSRFGVRGRSPGQLQRPTGVAVHPSGDIIIADYDNKWVSIFSCEGKFKVCVLICLELKGYCTLLRANAHSNVFCVVDLCSNLIVCICCSPGKTWLWKTHGTKGRVCGPKRTCYCGWQQSLYCLHLSADWKAYYQVWKPGQWWQAVCR